MKAVFCNYCGESFNPKRKELGYDYCLDCGSEISQREKEFKAKCTAPAYNKGAYTYISTKDQVKGIFKSGDSK